MAFHFCQCCFRRFAVPVAGCFTIIWFRHIFFLWVCILRIAVILGLHACVGIFCAPELVNSGQNATYSWTCTLGSQSMSEKSAINQIHAEWPLLRKFGFLLSLKAASFWSFRMYRQLPCVLWKTGYDLLKSSDRWIRQVPFRLRVSCAD